MTTRAWPGCRSATSIVDELLAARAVASRSSIRILSVSKRRSASRMNVNSSSTVGRPAGSATISGRARPAGRARARRDPRGGVEPSPGLYRARRPAARLCDPPRVDEADALEIAPDPFREVMGHFATGISVVTAFDGDRPAGITVNAFSSVSLEPRARHGRARSAAVHHADGAARRPVRGERPRRRPAALSDCFAHAPVSPGREDFCGAAWHPGRPACRCIDGAIATLECTIVETFSAGDHDLFIGRVDSLEQHREGVAPLLYFRRRYLRVEQGADSPVEGKPEG